MKFFILCLLGMAMFCEVTNGLKGKVGKRVRDEAENEALVDSISSFIEQERQALSELAEEIRNGGNNINQMRGVRLIGENGYPSRTAGRLEVFKHGEWGTVCDDSTTNALASVVCRSRSEYCNNWDPYPKLIQYPRSKVNVPANIWMDDVVCEGYEDSIYDCNQNPERHNCVHLEDVNIDCCGEYVEPVVGTEEPISNVTEIPDYETTGEVEAVTGAPEEASAAPEEATAAPEVSAAPAQADAAANATVDASANSTADAAANSTDTSAADPSTAPAVDPKAPAASSAAPAASANASRIAKVARRKHVIAQKIAKKIAKKNAKKHVKRKY